MSLTASKHFNVLMGIDVHMVIVPPNPGPTPLPHPFVGITYDVMDYLPILGTQLHVNGMKRSNSGTVGKLGITKHIPMGTGFYPATMPMIAHEAEEFFGSPTVKAEGSYFSGAPFNMMTCSCIGIPLGSAEKYLPTTASIPMQAGKPVLVGGPQVPDPMGIVMRVAMNMGLKFLKKGFKKLKSSKLFGGCGC